MRRAAVLLSVALLAGCGSTGKPNASVSTSVTSWAVEDGNHVSAELAYTNNGTSAATVLCTVGAQDSGGTTVGTDTDAPDAAIPAGQTVSIRVVIKTDVDSSQISDVTFDPAVPCINR